MEELVNEYEVPVGNNPEAQGPDALIPHANEGAAGPIFNVNLNLNMGFVSIMDKIMVEKDQARYQGTMVTPNKPSLDLYRLWAKILLTYGL